MSNYHNTSKSTSLWIVFFAYLSAIVLAAVCIYFLPDNYSLLQKSLFADVLATIMIFAFSVYFSNSSFYDPYWSLIPIILVSYWFVISGKTLADLRSVLVLILVSWWGLRLTWNWILRWQGIKDEDFRYIDLKNKSKSLWWFTDFMGIHLFPTLIVFGALIPLITIFEQQETPLNLIDGIAVLITVLAIILETKADNQLRKFKESRTDKNQRLTSGLWKFVKYPNYLGEVLFWWGLFFFALAVNVNNWHTIYGPVIMSLLFIFVSVPLMKKRLSMKI